MAVASVRVGAHTTKSSPSPHVLWRIVVVDENGSQWQVWRRFSDFARLDIHLAKIYPAPYALPSRDALITQATLYGFLDDLFLASRRVGLQRYLDGIAFSKSSKLLRESGAWKDFIGLVGTKFLCSPSADDSKPQPPIPVAAATDAVPAPTPVDNRSTGSVAAPPQGTPEATPGSDDSSKAPSAINTSVLKGPKIVKTKSTGKAPYKVANSYYLHAFQDDDRAAVLNAIAAAGFSYIRIFIAAVYANNKGSKSRAVPDVEPKVLGSYDDTALLLIDQLMVECQQRGLKLIIALHDRYALGFWATDAYALKYRLVAPNTSGAQRVVDASTFYTSNDAMTHFDKRIDHILRHTNAKLGGRKWQELDDVVFAFEPQNEPCGHMQSVPYAGWVDDRAGRIKQNLPSGSRILVANGGCIDFQSSMASWLFNASNVDIVCVHDYGTTPWQLCPNISDAAGRAVANGKTLLFAEWGASGANKSKVIADYVQALKSYNLSWGVWECSKPGAGSADYEVWTDEPAWAVLAS